MRFRDKVVWVTGASSGIGEATAVAFSHEGAQLILSARRAEELQRVRQQCANPERHRVLPLDLVDEQGNQLRITNQKGKQVKYRIVARDGYYAPKS